MVGLDVCPQSEEKLNGIKSISRRTMQNDRDDARRLTADEEGGDAAFFLAFLQHFDKV